MEARKLIQKRGQKIIHTVKIRIKEREKRSIQVTTDDWKARKGTNKTEEVCKKK